MTTGRANGSGAETSAPTSRLMSSGATVTFQRVEELPDDSIARYEVEGVSVTVQILDNLVTAEGARTLEDLWSDLLSKHWRRAGRLVLVRGEGGR